MNNKVPKKPIVKMSDLARMAGVSSSTVSRALQNSELINKVTRERIQALAKKQNYRLNTQARNFRLKETLTIAVFIPSAEAAKWQFSDPFFLELLGSIAESLKEKGHDMLLSTADLLDMGGMNGALKKINCDGIIVIGQARVLEQLETLSQTYAPMVVWGAAMPGHDYCTVGSDNLRGGYLATEHLIARGCRQIAIIGDWSTPEGKLRYQGYLQALKDAGLSRSNKLRIATGSGKDEGHNATLKLLSSGIKFDAIFALSDVLAMAAINSLDQHSFQVPADVAVAGYDDIALSRYYTPSITTVHQDREIGGRVLVESLLKIIEGESAESFTFPTHLVVRNSTQR